MLNGETRLVTIIGHPVAQVKSPATLTAAFAKVGHNAVCVPLDVEPADFVGVMTVLRRIHNLDGIVVTVPHKLACFDQCDTVTDRAAAIGAVNVVKRDTSGRLHGDMCDGEGFVAAARAAGGVLQGQDALLFGAGGAGIAIGFALVAAGVRSLAVCDPDHARRNALVDRLKASAVPVVATDGDPRGFTVIVNATPVGMGSTALPFSTATLEPSCFIGDVVTGPEDTALIKAARHKQCKTVSGAQMYDMVGKMMIEFLRA